jgi:hypothetical protein
MFGYCSASSRIFGACCSMSGCCSANVRATSFQPAAIAWLLLLLGLDLLPGARDGDVAVEAAGAGAVDLLPRVDRGLQERVVALVERLLRDLRDPGRVLGEERLEVVGSYCGWVAP